MDPAPSTGKWMQDAGFWPVPGAFKNSFLLRARLGNHC